MAAFPNILENASVAALHHLVKSPISPNMLGKMMSDLRASIKTVL
jgi:hypothetical protein